MKYNKENFHKLVVEKKSNAFELAKKDMEQEDQRLANAKIALQFISYMKRNSCDRKELAQRLEISTQYLSRILRCEVNITIGKAVSYGKRLGFKLIEFPTLPTYSEPRKTQKRRIPTERYTSMSTIMAISYSI